MTELMTFWEREKSRESARDYSTSSVPLEKGSQMLRMKKGYAVAAAIILACLSCSGCCSFIPPQDISYSSIIPQGIYRGHIRDLNEESYIKRFIREPGPNAVLEAQQREYPGFCKRKCWLFIEMPFDQLYSENVISVPNEFVRVLFYHSEFGGIRLAERDIVGTIRITGVIEDNVSANISLSFLELKLKLELNGYFSKAELSHIYPYAAEPRE